MSDFWWFLEITAHVCIVLTFLWNVGSTLFWMYAKRRFITETGLGGSNDEEDLDINNLLQRGADALQEVLKPKSNKGLQPMVRKPKTK
jgi:hypothetical protein